MKLTKQRYQAEVTSLWLEYTIRVELYEAQVLQEPSPEEWLVYTVEHHPWLRDEGTVKGIESVSTVVLDPYLAPDEVPKAAHMMVQDVLDGPPRAQWRSKLSIQPMVRRAILQGGGELEHYLTALTPWGMWTPKDGEAT